MPSALPRFIGINHVALEVGEIEEAMAFHGIIFRFALRGGAATARPSSTWATSFWR